MKKLLLIGSLFISTLMLLTDVHAQRALGGNSLKLDNGAGLIIKIVPPPNLLESYTWFLPPKAPPQNTAFTQGGSLTGQTVRWDHALGYWVPTSALFISGNNIGNNVGIGTVTPNQLLEVWGTSGTPNARFGSLSGTSGWSTNANGSDGFVMADGNGDLIKRNPFTITNQFAWAIGGNTNPTSSVLGTLTNNPLAIQTLGTSRMVFSTNGDILIGNPLTAAVLTLEPGSGGTLTINNIPNDDASVNFLTVDGSNRVRYRTFASILGVNANEGLVYDSPNIKLGATNGTINPFVTSRFVNLNNNSLTFSTAGGATSLLTLRGSDGNVGIGTATPNTFKLEVAGSVGPTQNNLYTLGTVSKRYKDLYLGPSSLFIGNGGADQTKQSYSVTSSVSRLSFDMDDNGTNDVWMEETGLIHANGNVDATGDLIFGGDLKPDGNSGTSGQYLKSNGSGTTPTWTSITQSAWGISGNSNVDSSTHFVGATNNNAIVFKTNGIPRAKFMESTFSEDSGAFIPWRDNSYQLGTPSHRWRDVYVGPGSLRIGSFGNTTKGSQNQQTVDEVTLSYANGNLIIDKPVANFGSMVPNTNNVLELGSSTNRWADLWLGPNSLHIGAPTYEGTISYDPTAKQLKFNSNNTIGSSEMIIDSLGDVTIPSLGAGGLLKANVGGKIALATGGADFEAPLTFSNGLTRTLNNIVLGGALGANTSVTTGAYSLTFTTASGNVSIASTGLLSTPSLAVGSSSAFTVNTLGAISAATGITSSGTVTFSGLPTGIVHSTAGVLSSSAVVSADIQDGTVADADLRNSAALSVIGRSANTVGVPADITAGTDGHVLRRSGTTLGFGTIATSGITAGGNNTFLVTNNSTTVAWSGLNANATNLSGNGIGTALDVVTGNLTSTDITVGTGTGRLVGGSATLTIANDAVTFAKMQNIASSRLVGRTTASPGDAEEISVNGTLTLSSLTLGLNLGNTNTWTAAQTFSSGVSVSGGLDAQSTTSTTSIRSVASGASAGKAADFSNDNASNANDLVVATNAGSGWTGKFDGTGTNSKGIYINAGQDKKGLQVNRGSVILSHTNDAASNNINPNGDLNSVHAVDDDGAVGGSTFKLPVGTNGQILYIFNGDTNGNLTIQQNLHASNTGPTSIPFGNTVICIYVTNATGSGWVTK